MESKRHASPESELMPDEKRQKHDDGGEQKTEQISLSCTETKDEQMQGSSSTAEVQTSDDIKERIDQDDEQKVNKAECSGNGNINSQIAGDAVNITVPDRWQTSCRSMKDRMAKLYKSSFLTDCVFIVGDVNVKEYRLHALILSMASPVFEDLLSDVNNRVIKITDVESEVFDQILEYIYLDLLHLESVEKTQALYRAAQKLKLTLIIERAVQLMMGSMNFDNIWPTLESAQITCDMILRAECLKYFKKHTRELLKHPKFTTVDRSVVQDLVSEEVLEGILEVELVAGVISWAKAQCEKNNMANNLENKREFLGNEIISKLRFLNLPQISFVKEAASTSSKPDDSILTREESYAILLNLIVPGIEPLPDIVCKESKLRIAGKLRVTRKVMPSAGFPPPFTLPFPAAQFDKMVVLPNPTPISPFGAKSFCCDIVVSYPIKLIGIQAPTFFSPQNISAEYEENYIVTVQASHTSRNLASTTLKGKVKYNSSIEIIFKDSVLIERNIKYSIFIYTSNMYYVSRTLALHENRPPVQFTFKDTVSYFGAPSNASLVTDFGFLTELIYNL